MAFQFPAEERNPHPAIRKAAKERIDYLPELFTRELLWAAMPLFLVIIALLGGCSMPAQEHSNPPTPLLKHTTAPW